MKQLLAFLVFVLVITSCSIERRHYLPGYHVEGRTSSVKGLVTNDEGLVTSDEGLVTNDEGLVTNDEGLVTNDEGLVTSDKGLVTSHSPFATGHSSLVIRHSLSPDTLKKPFKPQPQYREVDPVGKYAVYTVFVGVALQKLAGMLTWFEVAVPLSFGPAIFIPAVIVALVGVGLSAYSAYRVRKYPEKYKKSEWGKAALAILGWQVLMSALFAWLLL